VDDFPGAKIVAAHLGAYAYWREVEEYLLGRPLYFDTSYCSIGMTPGYFKTLIYRHGVERVIFGSDSPWTAQEQELSYVRKLNLGEADTEAILGGNAIKLLGL